MPCHSIDSLRVSLTYVQTVEGQNNSLVLQGDSAQAHREGEDGRSEEGGGGWKGTGAEVRRVHREM
jgi:hypothetical protein